MSSEFDWIQVGELADGFSENILPDSSDLAGKSIKLSFENGMVINYKFNDISSLTWKVIEGSEKEVGDDEIYRATCPRKGFYFVDFVKRSERATSVSLVLDFASGIATAIIGTLPTEKEAKMDMLSRIDAGLNLTAVNMQFSSSAIDKRFDWTTPRHEPTSDLVGKRVKYVYSGKDAYEHIYLNEKLYTWHCLAGAEKGLADTELCHYFKIAHDLYLFVWREKIVPTLGVVVIDMQKMKTTGKIFGYESNDFGKLTNFPVGAFAKLINVSKYD